MKRAFQRLGRSLFASGLIIASGAAPALAQAPAAPAGQPAVELKVGDMAPDFTMRGSDDKTYKLSDMRGHYVVLAWFPMAFTGG